MKRLGNQESAQSKSLRQGDGRVARLARWLANLPISEAFDQLHLEVKNDGVWTLHSAWPRSQVHEATAVEIDRVVSDHADELGALIVARCVWWSSSEERYGVEHALRVQPTQMDVSQVFSGDGTSATIQTQRHLERREQLQNVMLREAMEGLRQAAEDSRKRAQRAEDVCDDLRARNTQLAEELERAELLLEEMGERLEKLEELAGEQKGQGQVLSLAMAAMGVAPPKKGAG